MKYLNSLIMSFLSFFVAKLCEDRGSFQIETAWVKQFSSNVWHLAQQKGSRLAGMVRNESQNSEFAFYDNIGAVTAQKKVGRHSDTTFQDTPHGRRRNQVEDFFHADLVDKEDKLRMIMSPESEYAQAAKNAMGRAMDDSIIEALYSDASTGKEGAGTQALPNSQKIVSVENDGTSTTGFGLTHTTLRQVKKKFHQNEVEIEGGDLFFVLAAEQLDDLLADDKIINADYSAVKALVQGDVDTYMGFKFVRSERLPTDSSAFTYNQNDGSIGAGAGTSAALSRRCFAWKKEGVLLATSASVNGQITERPDKHYAKQVYTSMSIGGTRMEEAKVVEVLCKE